MMGRPRTIQVNHEVFSPLPEELSEEACYWLGFIFADGCVSAKPRWCLAVNLKHQDLDHLLKLEAFLGGRARAGKKAARYMAFSKELVQLLVMLGVLPRKSTEPGLPPEGLTDEQSIALLRGMFDGDGCLHEAKRFGALSAHFCGHPDVVDWFITAMLRHNVPKPGSLRKRGNTTYAQWAKQDHALLLAETLYGRAARPKTGPALARKVETAHRALTRKETR